MIWSSLSIVPIYAILRLVLKPARPPRVVFVIGVASLIHSLTSGKKHLQYTNVVVVVVLSAYPARQGRGRFSQEKAWFRD